ncbi:YjbH domain-containing protein [uncultured Jannaschia sp.]|uniref:YjbH domain-containing protein n=1 Tax=uncultured Jannaschia sp. TaxID=293347 RepID=UPI002617D84B|nr:YjbH domain-containing protein [uncultured Jannaschia sp.]
MARSRTRLAAILLGTVAVAGPVGGQGIEPALLPVSYTLGGAPGLIEMPTAQSAPDAELAATLSYGAGTGRTSLTFQITPRLSGTFRYASIDGLGLGGTTTYDRSFDLRYRVLDEGRITPAIAIGINDLVGTGLYSSEYVVATKSLTDRLTGTLGIGWGRLAGVGAFDNPLGVFDGRFDTRPPNNFGQGGNFDASRYFRGDAALFGGLTYAHSDDLLFKIEYSSDASFAETAAGNFERRTPINFGVDWNLRPGVRLQGALLHGDTAAIGVTFALNAKRPAVNGGLDPAPQAVLVRAPGAAADLGWTAQADAPDILRGNLETALANDGIVLEGLRLDSNSATILIRNTRWNSTAQAVGRTARVMTRTLPASVETFEIVPTSQGTPTVGVTLARTDIELLENDPDASWRSYVRAELDSAEDAWDGAVRSPELYPRFTWALGPYVEASYFDPDSPVRLDFGAELDARYDIAPGLSLAGTLRQRLIGNRDDATRPSNSVIQRVRSESNLYAREDLSLTRLYGNYQFRPGENLYGRVTAGYLERAYAGVSTELLWKPPSSSLALGVELNYARQRAFDDLFDLQDYDVVTGHASAYWRAPNGFDFQLDAGRYLAGDTGATLSIDRTFGNGWRVGAYATLTDVSFSDFGEGSFDKGIRVSIPLSHFTGNASTRKARGTIQPILRDGGARLRVDNRLYEQVREDHDPALRRSWGRFWR